MTNICRKDLVKSYIKAVQIIKNAHRPHCVINAALFWRRKSSSEL